MILIKPRKFWVEFKSQALDLKTLLIFSPLKTGVKDLTFLRFKHWLVNVTTVCRPKNIKHMADRLPKPIFPLVSGKQFQSLLIHNMRRVQA